MQRTLRVGALGAIAIALWSAAATAQPFVYVADLGSDDVLVIDAATLGPVASLPFGEDPDGLAVSPDGRRVYVAGFLSNTVGEIDAETHQLLATVPVGEGPVGLAVTPDGARVYVTQRGADSVAAIGVASGTVEAVIPVGRGPNAIAITPDGTTAFVTNSFAPLAGEVSVLDLATDQVRNTITVGRKPSRVAITPDGRTAYVTNFRSWTSTAIDVASETVRTTFRAGLKSSAVAVNPNGAWAYIIDQRGGISIVDVSVDQVTRSIEIGGGIGGIAILRNGGTAYVARSTLQVVDLGEEEVVAEVAVGDRPFAVAANCVGDGCTETPYTPKPTKTATETPTPTLTPTPTSTLTATATVTPTRTLESGRTHVLFTLTTNPTTAGEHTLLSLQLDTGGQVVHGIRELVALTDSIGVPPRDNAFDCDLAPGIEAQRAEFSLVYDACGAFCDGLEVTIDFDQPLTGTFAIYSCRLNVYDFSPIGTVRLRHLDNTALDGDGGSLPSRARDAVLIVAPKASPSPDLTPRPTRTPTQPPLPVIFIGGDPIAALPGETATLTMRLTTDGREVVGTQNDIELPNGLSVAPRGGGRPDCTVNPDIDKRATSFAFLPPSCTPGVNCTGIRALVLSLDGLTAIPDGALYTCALQIGSAVVPGAYSLRVTNAGGSTADGEAIETGGIPVAVTVSGAAGVRRAAATAARVCSGGASDGVSCTVDADCAAGACVLPLGVCDGGDDDGLLCDCPGGSCRAAGAACGGGPDAGICNGGDADGSCCDRAFSCRGGHACVTTHRLCANGPVKGSPCLADAQCLGSACLASARRCAGGDLDGVACIDGSDCPAATCLDPHAPTPTRIVEATPIVEPTLAPEVSHASSSSGCAIATPDAGRSYWWMAPALLLLVRKRQRRR